jgi:hypothetical protein
MTIKVYIFELTPTAYIFEITLAAPEPEKGMSGH